MKVTSTVSQFVRALFGVLGLGVAVAGCGGGGDSGPTCDVPKIFADNSCATPLCHYSTKPAANFDMRTAGWEKTLVGKAPPGGGPTDTTLSLCANMNKVYLQAGSVPAKGLFLDKITATPGCGARMPNLPTVELSPADIACVQTWANALTAP